MKTTTSQQTRNHEQGMTDGFRHFHKQPQMLPGVIGLRSKKKGWSGGFTEAMSIERRKEALNGKS